jgi:hypothetical protein
MVVIQEIIYAGVAAIAIPIRRIHCGTDDGSGALVKAQLNRYQ